LPGLPPPAKGSLFVGGSSGKWPDIVFWLTCAAFGLGVLVTLVLMGLEMLRASLPIFESTGIGFVFGREWNPVSGEFGALPFMYGTVVSSLLALVIAVPVSFGVAIYLDTWCPLWLRAPIGFMVELLAAVPSVVYGLWGIFALAPLMRDVVNPFLANTLGFLPAFQGPSHGFGMLTGGVILAIMITPTISSVSREVLRAVPLPQREGALALGATSWEMVWTAVLPYARSGLVGAVILGLGRALGETMAITMVIGNRVDITQSLFAPAYTMAAVIANEFAEASDDIHLAALSGIGLLLFAVTVLLNVVARLLVWQVARGESRA
jgi:phosphate transport system permease protein